MGSKYGDSHPAGSQSVVTTVGSESGGCQFEYYGKPIDLHSKLLKVKYFIFLVNPRFLSCCTKMFLNYFYLIACSRRVVNNKSVLVFSVTKESEILRLLWFSLRLRV